jgi:Fe-S cluster assembly protein SufB
MHEVIEEKISAEYNHGFVTDIDADNAPKGLNEYIIRFIYAKKNEPEWMLVYRLEAFRNWLTMEELDWLMFLARSQTFRKSFIIQLQNQKKY